MTFRLNAISLVAAAVIVGVAGLTTIYLGTALTRVAEGLPIEILEQERGVAEMIGRLEDAVQAFELVDIAPGPERREAASDALEAAAAAARDIRRSYNLDNLLGAAALHASVSPAIDDAVLWAKEGVAGREPESPFVLRLIMARLREALAESRALRERARHIAEDALRHQAEQVRTIRERTYAGMAAFVLFALLLAYLVLHQRRLFNEREAAIDEANRANRAKSEFLAHMSHELRTPLNAAIGFAEMIERQIIGPIGNIRYIGYAVDIRKSAEFLLSIIGDILDLSKIEAGQMVLDETAVDLGIQADAAMHLLAGLAAKKKLRMRIAAEPNMPRLKADVRAVRRIVINLLTNAVKYTEHGVVEIALGVDAGGGLTVKVTDTGIGMAEEDIPLARRPFGRIRNVLVRSAEGTGLGLPLCEQLAHLHGAKLTIDSARGRGTSVAVNFPRDRTIAHESAAS